MRAGSVFRRQIWPSHLKHDLSLTAVRISIRQPSSRLSTIGHFRRTSSFHSSTYSHRLRRLVGARSSSDNRARVRDELLALKDPFSKPPRRIQHPYYSPQSGSRWHTVLRAHDLSEPRKIFFGNSSLRKFQQRKPYRACVARLSTYRNEGGKTSAMLVDGSHRAVVAFGSNLGDRVNNIERALGLMRGNGLRVISVSHLYETEPMYYENQDSFLNGVCLIETELEPLNLLDVLQKIENELGRVRNIDKGPRTVDLDIILYDTIHLVHERLKIPHPLMLEREFVLRPLADVVPEEKLPETFLGSDSTFSTLSVANAFEKIRTQKDPMTTITVLKSGIPFLRADNAQRRTQVMGILNITPDSFSDGGDLYSEKGLANIEAYVGRFIAAGATIVDVGGQSTRPNATLFSAEEELERVLPVLKAIRSMPEASNVVISVDTFYSKVAEKAIQEGADIINDVSAGLLDPNMLSTVARLGKSIVLMHMRGNPQTMDELCDYPRGVVKGVAEELAARLQEALKVGILPWRIILDPGIGFAKTQQQNLDLLREAQSLRKMSSFAGLPWLIGTSRKGFIGKITGVQKAAERQWGTAATVTAAIAGGADIIRVHDVQEMSEVRTMADAIYRAP